MSNNLSFFEKPGPVLVFIILDLFLMNKTNYCETLLGGIIYNNKDKYGTTLS